MRIFQFGFRGIAWLLVATGIGCAAAPTLFHAGDAVVRKIDAFQFETDQPGKVMVEVDHMRCSDRPIRLRLQGEGKPQEAVATCVAGIPVVQFVGQSVAGKYTVRVIDEGGAREIVRGRVFFQPQEPEAQSGADQAYLGATPLQEGANTATLNPSAADRTDWWSMQVPKSGRAAIFLQHPLNMKGLQAFLYRWADGSLSLKQRLAWNRVSELHMEGSYYLKVVAGDLTPQVTYTVAWKAPAAGAAGAGGEGASGALAAGAATLNVLETWPLDAGKTAVLVGGGSSQTIKLGEQLKLFRNGQFLDACKVMGVGLEESECHVDRGSITKLGLTARRGAS